MNQLELNNKNCGECNLKIDLWDGCEAPYFSKNRKAFENQKSALQGDQGGAIYIKKGVQISPVLHGGGQEGGLRSGTINIAGVVGFGKAAEIAEKDMKNESKRLKQLRNKLINDYLLWHRYRIL